jgi:protocatechuate 3,4-dioxygenase beta subunit
MPLGWRSFLLFLLIAVAAFAQFSSNIQGTVEDPSGSSVPGATVTIQNVNTQVKQSTTANEAGFYRFSSLPPGSYEVRTEAQGCD